MNSPTSAIARGVATITHDGTVLDVWYPAPLVDEPVEETGTRRLAEPDARFEELVGPDEARGVARVAVETAIKDIAEPAVDTYDVYLRLHLLSHRLIRPHGANMDGVFGLLSNVVWTNYGPCAVSDFQMTRGRLAAKGPVVVFSVDKFPRMVDYVVPSGVTIAEAERVRLGAYLAEGTSVMREGYVSYNAGTLGPARLEGRLSSSVVVGGGTDLSLSSALMASRVSEHERAPMRVGRDCRLHPSAGVIGVDLGDRCEIGVNVMLEPDTMVFDVEAGTQVPARAIAGRADLRIEREPFSTSPVVRRRTLDVD